MKASGGFVYQLRELQRKLRAWVSLQGIYGRAETRDFRRMGKRKPEATGGGSGSQHLEFTPSATPPCVFICIKSKQNPESASLPD